MVGTKQDRIAVVRKNLEKLANNIVKDAKECYRSVFSEEMPLVEIMLERKHDHCATVTFYYGDEALLSLKMETNFRLYYQHKIFNVFCGSCLVLPEERPLLGRYLSYVCYIASHFSGLKEAMKELGGIWRIYRCYRNDETMLQFISSRCLRGDFLVEKGFNFVFSGDGHVEVKALLRTKNNWWELPVVSYEFSINSGSDLDDIASKMAALVPLLTL